MSYPAPIYASSFSETLPGTSMTVPQSAEPSFPGSPISMSQSYSKTAMGQPMSQSMGQSPISMPSSQPMGQSPISMSPSQQMTSQQMVTKTLRDKREKDIQIMDKLGEVFGQTPVVSYWPLLTYIIVWTVFGLVIFIIFLSAGQVGWGFYYLCVIIFTGIVFSMFIWVLNKEGYTTVSWVIVGLFFFVAIGFVIWASIAFPKLKNLSRSPMG